MKTLQVKTTVELENEISIDPTSNRSLAEYITEHLADLQANFGRGNVSSVTISGLRDFDLSDPRRKRAS